MKNRLLEFLVGLLAGTSLIIAGMTDPGKVIGFLDLAGQWDPSLALVMGGAIAVAVVGFALAKRRPLTVLGAPLHLPPTRGIDRPLIFGSLAFGAGWGLAGFCPGPAIVSVGAGQAKALGFVLAMLAGIGLYQWLIARASTSAEATTDG